MTKKYGRIILFIIVTLMVSLFTMCTNKDSYSEEEKSGEEIVDNNINNDIKESNYLAKEIDEKEEEKREKRTVIKGNNKDVVTLMIYMCGSDLESKYGTGSVDIDEILAASTSENLNIIIETGGSKDWTNPLIREDSNQRFKVENGQLVLIKDDLGERNMAEPSTLTDFINYSTEKFPANRYGLIMWNHGYGALEGIAKDEKFQGDTMELASLSKALEDSNTFFDFIGFDACFMSTIEVAYTLEDYADYLIASAEIEPFAGWYYTNWISQLANNTSINTEDIGKIIVDDFVEHNTRGEIPEEAILAITDLTKINYAYNKLSNIFEEINSQLSIGNYSDIAMVRSETNTFAENLIDHIDIKSLAESFNGKLSQEVISAIDECIVYKGNTSTMAEVGGLSIYFPYYKMNYYNKFKSDFERLDLSEKHFNLINNIVRAVKEEKIEIIGSARKFDEDKEAEVNRYNSN